MPSSITRRDALKATAGATAAVSIAVNSAMALGADADPAFAAIERHRNVFSAYLAAFIPFNEADEARAALPHGSPDLPQARALADARHLDVDRLGEDADAIAYELADTLPTTLAGCAAVLHYAVDHNDAAYLFPDQLDGADEPAHGYGRFDGGHRALWDHRLRVSLAKALATIAEKGALS